MCGWEDTTDAQCIQTTTDHLTEVANQMAAAGLINWSGGMRPRGRGV
jgi:hypothetical protein